MTRGRTKLPGVLAAILCGLLVTLSAAAPATAAGRRSAANGSSRPALGASGQSTQPTPGSGDQSTQPTPGSSGQSTQPTPGSGGQSTQPPVSAAARLLLPAAFLVSGHLVTVPGRPLHVQGIVRPYVPGQVVMLDAYLNGRLLVSRQITLRRSGEAGTLGLVLRAPRPGRLAVAVAHQATAQMSSFETRRALTVLDPRARFGSRGLFVSLIQQRLADMHFYLRRTGVYDSFTGLAIDAYHRLLGWGTSQLLNGRTISFLLDGFGQFHVRFPGQGRHAEGDLTHQLLALVDHNNVRWILPISSGSPSTPTVLGSWRIYLRDPGYLPDGMYYSDFFYRGYAIHGYDPAPDYPASHGCMRLPIQDAIFVYDWLAMGDWVDTYYR